MSKHKCGVQCLGGCSEPDDRIREAQEVANGNAEEANRLRTQLEQAQAEIKRLKEEKAIWLRKSSTKLMTSADAALYKAEADATQARIAELEGAVQVLLDIDDEEKAEAAWEKAESALKSAPGQSLKRIEARVRIEVLDWMRERGWEKGDRRQVGALMDWIEARAAALEGEESRATLPPKD